MRIVTKHFKTIFIIKKGNGLSNKWQIQRNKHSLDTKWNFKAICHTTMRKVKKKYNNYIQQMSPKQKYIQARNVWPKISSKPETEPLKIEHSWQRMIALSSFVCLDDDCTFSISLWYVLCKNDTTAQFFFGGRTKKIDMACLSVTLFMDKKYANDVPYLKSPKFNFVLSLDLINTILDQLKIIASKEKEHCW